GHRLHAAIGAVRAESSVTIELEPLSERAVASLAGDEQAAKIFAASRGNPFYVTELLTDRTGSTLPMSVANSVLGRAARLDRQARELVELVSVGPRRGRASARARV